MTAVAFDQATSWRRRLLVGLALAALLAGQAHADPRYAIDISAGPLEAAILSLAKQTRQQVFFSKSMVAGRRAPALHGRYTADQALAALLVSTDISASRAGPHLLVLQRTPPAPVPRLPAREAEADRPFVTVAQGPNAVEAEAPVPSEPARGSRPAAATEVEAVEVTGSHIRGAPPASPLLVMSQEDLERSGQTTLVDALRALPENFGGGAAEGANTTGADRLSRNGGYGTALNLRGLGNNATLVLVNGRRVAASGAFSDFVDISTIPTGAVQRVEVLLDGASAVYGSDAVGGVVNVILRKPFDGAETRLLGGIGTAGEPAQGRLSQTFGKRWDTGGVVLSYELSRRDYLHGADRPFAANADLRPLGGTDLRLTNAFPGNILLPDPVTRALTPAFAIPAGQNGVGLRPGALLPGVINRTNQREGVDILPRQTLNAVYLYAEQALGPRLDLTADARYSARRYKSHSAPFTSNLTVTTANPFYVSPIGANSEVIAYSFADELPNPVATGTVETVGASLGGTLRMFGDWRAEASGTYAQEIAEIRGLGVLNSAFLSEALGAVPDRPDTAFSTARDGFFNPFSGVAGSNKAAVLAHIGSGFSITRSVSKLSAVGVQADGSLWSLPAGAVKLAVGAQARRETLDRSGSNFFSTGTPVPQGRVDQGRTVTAAFAEVRAPLFGPDNRRPGLERLDLSLAGRIERYPSFGTTANPKVGLLWAPVEDLRIRASYGRSFRAPALREAFDAPLYTPTQFLVGATRIQGLLLAGGNEGLKPETARSWAVGFDYRPASRPGLTLSVTGYDIRFHNRIDRPVASNVTNALVDPTLSAFVTRISPTTNPADRALIVSLLSGGFLNTGAGTFPVEAYGAIVDNRFVNTATLRIRGLDVNGGYQFDVGGDRVALAAHATYVLTYDQQITPTSAQFDRVGVVNFPVRFRGRATADWTRGRLTVGGAVNYVSAYRDALGARIDDQPTFDLQARLTPPETGPMKGVSLLFNVRNVFDRDPPFYNNPVGVGFDGANSDPIGRFVSVQLTRTW